MNKLLLALAGAAVLTAVTAPANATINIYVDDPGALQPDENVLFNEPGTGVDGNPLFGHTNQTDTWVTFIGTEDLTAPSGGQARVEALDGTLDYLKILLTDPDLAFKEIEFNVERITGGRFVPFDITVDFTDNFGNIFSTTSQIETGSNWFSAQAVDGQWIKHVTLNTSPNQVRAVEQVRIGGIGTPGVVPEPATWAMLIAGFGLVGFTMRRRSSVVRTSN